ncbi:MAG: DUF4174 domain-containing protein [Winogradskyella sp.]|uniref:DUF4174 domain-containing protein n=1 Tax=Winogradskyella sp. TaxID=1883156 RepID=UPI0025D5B65A|nr:DUF4174 domain-containing protein [Winogradskyella sp.]NRB82170.1 DUF4174 domain-containing protein [Winogradskyella sp.]
MLFSITSNAQDLNALKWKNRILIIKATKNNDLKFEKQLTEFKSQDNALKERKLVLYTMNNQKLTIIDYTTDTTDTSKRLSDDMMITIFSAKNEFEVILIGLDGSIKLRQTEVLSKEDLIAIIDAMPMRKSEIKNR